MTENVVNALRNNMLRRELQHANWEWDEAAKELVISVIEGDTVDHPGSMNTIRLSKTYMFSLMRFMIRVAQSLGRSKRKRGVTENED